LILYEIFEAVVRVTAESDRPLYSVAAVPDFAGCFVGRDNEDTASILLQVDTNDRRQQAPLRLANLEVLFGLQCSIKHKGTTSEGAFTVLRCRATEREVIRYFFTIGETLLRLLGSHPTPAALSDAVSRFVMIFQKLQKAPMRSVVGLLGELFVIRQSYDPGRMLLAWRATDHSRFDFSADDVRIDVKATLGRVRTHTFSYEQCNPPPGTIALAASIFVEETSGGPSLRNLVDEIAQAIAHTPHLLIRFHEIIAETLGNGLNEAMTFRFDEKLAATSLQYFELKTIPGIRGTLPIGISDVHFRSDLSATTPVSIRDLREIHSQSRSFLELLL
jgi:hypothetical protein